MKKSCLFSAFPRRAPEIRMTYCFGMGQTLGTQPMVWLIVIISRNDQMCDLGPMVAKIMETIPGIALEMQLCKVLVTSINLNLR